MTNNDTNILSSDKPYKLGSVVCIFGFYENAKKDKSNNILFVRKPDYIKRVELTNEIYNALASTLLFGQTAGDKASIYEVPFFANLNVPYSNPPTLGTDYIMAYFHCFVDSNLFSYYDNDQNRIVIDAETSEQMIVVDRKGDDTVDKLQYLPFFAVYVS